MSACPPHLAALLTRVTWSMVIRFATHVFFWKRKNQISDSKYYLQWQFLSLQMTCLSCRRCRMTSWPRVCSRWPRACRIIRRVPSRAGAPGLRAMFHTQTGWPSWPTSPPALKAPCSRTPHTTGQEILAFIQLHMNVNCTARAVLMMHFHCRSSPVHIFSSSSSLHSYARPPLSSSSAPSPARSHMRERRRTRVPPRAFTNANTYNRISWMA